MSKYKCIYNGNRDDNSQCNFYSKGLCRNSDFCPNKKLTWWSKIKNNWKDFINTSF